MPRQPIPTATYRFLTLTDSDRMSANYILPQSHQMKIHAAEDQLFTNLQQPGLRAYNLRKELRASLVDTLVDYGEMGVKPDLIQRVEEWETMLLAKIKAEKSMAV